MTLSPPPGVGSNGNSSFSKILPNFQIAWDSTSSGTIMECPRKYYYSHILGKEPHGQSVHLIFGQHYHRAQELFHHSRAQGAEFEEAVRVAVRYCLEATWDHKLGRGWISDLPEKNRLTLVRSIVWYFEQFQEDSLETVILSNGKPAVELSFRAEIGEAPTGETIYMCGHLDRLVTFNDDHYVADYKTSKSALTPDYFTRYSPDNQFSLYTFASQFVYSVPVKGLIVDAAQIGVTFSRFQRGFVHRTPDQLSEWFRDYQWYISLAYQYAEQDYWPMNAKSCGLYGGCPFRPVCAKAPSVRDQWLKSGFANRTWDPLLARGSDI
jgi:hypothetical protein